jgi:pimeloyl-ACP methyl ester carboxylesterase
VKSHLDRPNATLAYNTTGPADAKHTVLAAHSLATSRAWEDQTGLFDWNCIVEAGQQVARFDTRGHGDSTGTPDAEQYTWPALAADYIAIADATSPDRPIDGVGQSTGCGVLLWAAATRPERIRRLVLVIPPTVGAAREAQAQLYLAASQMVELRGIEAWQRVVSVTPPAPILTSGGWQRPTWIAVQDGLVPSVLRGAAKSVLPDDDQLRRIDQPTLILAWDGDPSHPTASAEYLADRIPKSTLEVATVPDEVRGWGRRVASFLDGA